LARIRLTVQYDGTEFDGWQLQPGGARTVQGVLEAAISKLCGGEPARIAAAGRTDAGVHARGQVVAFDAPVPRPMRAWVAGLNGLLPEDVAVLEAAEALPEFDPRRWSLGKWYRYRIWNGPTRAPLERRRSWAVGPRLDLDAMRAAAAGLVGEHDFASFQAAGCAARTTRREIQRLEISGAPGEAVIVDVAATAFLRHMVRNLVGTLVEVGLGRREAGAMAALIEGRDRRLAGRTAPAQGLCLEAVYYGEGPPERRRMVDPNEDDL
jgi:tRNA pseudouridine38-40 synthase